MVYPRPRGEAASKLSDDWNDQGLSPPTRGSPSARARFPGSAGSIPAHAGKPVWGRSGPGGVPVYPRPRGEAHRRIQKQRRVAGLSPPTRGSHSILNGIACRPGSIPAHAGKPLARLASGPHREVYPRPRGEAVVKTDSVFLTSGLSPPTRGSLRLHVLDFLEQRSIPAHAGKPVEVMYRQRVQSVYPRPRGEALRLGVACARFDGLSPPTRGSHTRSSQNRFTAGSIPAHAGKPRKLLLEVCEIRVYPRPRGEATAYSVPGHRSWGLSPPTRGSRPRSSRRARGSRSIPAHAGKPHVGRPCGDRSQVYPRPRGEARASPAIIGGERGLSPPTRGSLLPRRLSSV